MEKVYLWPNGKTLAMHLPAVPYKFNLFAKDAGTMLMFYFFFKCTKPTIATHSVFIVEYFRTLIEMNALFNLHGRYLYGFLELI